MYWCIFEYVSNCSLCKYFDTCRSLKKLHAKPTVSDPSIIDPLLINIDAPTKVLECSSIFHAL